MNLEKEKIIKQLTQILHWNNVYNDTMKSYIMNIEVQDEDTTSTSPITNNIQNKDFTLNNNENISLSLDQNNNCDDDSSNHHDDPLLNIISKYSSCPIS